MFGLGVPELLVIGVVALLVFGKRLPDVARSLGQSVVEFKKGLNAPPPVDPPAPADPAASQTKTDQPPPPSAQS